MVHPLQILYYALDKIYDVKEGGQDIWRSNDTVPVLWSSVWWIETQKISRSTLFKIVNSYLGHTDIWIFNKKKSFNTCQHIRTSQVPHTEAQSILLVFWSKPPKILQNFSKSFSSPRLSRRPGEDRVYSWISPDSCIYKTLQLWYPFNIFVCV